jgi:CRP-like cAMP-binding protein
MSKKSYFEIRLASLLVDLATRNGINDSNGIRLTVRMTRQNMANMVGHDADGHSNHEPIQA